VKLRIVCRADEVQRTREGGAVLLDGHLHEIQEDVCSLSWCLSARRCRDVVTILKPRPWGERGGGSLGCVCPYGFRV
jgi:hypothetical protein